jgi:hypothetical protein
MAPGFDFPLLVISTFRASVADATTYSHTDFLVGGSLILHYEVTLALLLRD